MSEAGSAIRRIAIDANGYLAGALDDLEKAQTAASRSLESHTAAMVAVHAVEGGSDVTERGQRLAAKAERLLPAAESSSSEGSDR